MLPPIRIHIKKKIRVPTISQAKYLWKTSWTEPIIIDYSESIKMFKRIGYGPIETDAEFGKFILDRIGIGDFLVIYWRKGKRGLKLFTYIRINTGSFQILRKIVRKGDKEKQQIMRLREKIKNKNYSLEDKKEFNNEIKEIRSEMGWLREILFQDKIYEHSYLKYTSPKYKPHSYSRAFKQPKRGDVDELW